MGKVVTTTLLAVDREREGGDHVGDGTRMARARW
jgi:hypothetical protein